ncbi:MAG: MBOAT family O-acyltransferase, partial [Candidatus Omnitrophota bacterium]
ESTLLDFSAYVLFFPTFICGPVERFPAFYEQSKQTGALAQDIPLLNYGLYRIAKGLVKKAFIADTIAGIVMPVLSCPEAYSRVAVVFSVYGLMLRVYMDFSGYTDMAVGAAGLFGYRIVENFNKPFLQKNIVMFWRNWHISLYTWIRDYFFLPVFGYVTFKWKVYAGILATMLVFHLWHGFSLNFLGAAIYNSAGIFLWMAFCSVKEKAHFLRRISGNVFSGSLALLVTFTFVSLGSVFLLFDIYGCFAIFARIFTWRI